MEEYHDLKPLYASALMYISLSGHFLDTIIYDYVDLNSDQSTKSNYYKYIQQINNYQHEKQIYWKNLQSFLDEERNLINNQEVHLDIIDVSIHFRDTQHIYVQWIIEFNGTFHRGLNSYENYIEPEILEYPISSTYIFESPLKVAQVSTELSYEIVNHGQIVRYEGKTGQKLGNHEKIQFRF
jgi:hypothetical protein